MEQLCSADLQAIVAFLLELYEVADLATFRRRLLTGLPALVPSDTVSYAEIDLAMKRVDAMTNPADAFDRRMASVIAECIAESPLLTAYRRGKGSAVKMSDFVSQAQLRRTRLYNEYFRKIGVEYQIAKGLPGPPGMVTAISQERSRRDFSERDREVLNLLRPHLNQGYRNAAFVTRVQDDLGLM